MRCRGSQENAVLVLQERVSSRGRSAGEAKRMRQLYLCLSYAEMCPCTAEQRHTEES